MALVLALVSAYTVLRWDRLAADIEDGAKFVAAQIRTVQPFITTFLSVCGKKILKDCQRRGFVAEPAPPPKPPKLVRKVEKESEAAPDTTTYTTTYTNIYDAPLNY